MHGDITSRCCSSLRKITKAEELEQRENVFSIFKIENPMTENCLKRFRALSLIAYNAINSIFRYRDKQKRDGVETLTNTDYVIEMFNEALSSCSSFYCRVATANVSLHAGHTRCESQYVHTYHAIMITTIRADKDPLVWQELLSMSIYLTMGIVRNTTRYIKEGKTKRKIIRIICKLFCTIKVNLFSTMFRHLGITFIILNNITI